MERFNMDTLTVPHNFIPRDYQLDVFKELDSKRHLDERKALLVWPRQIGKDTSCFAYMCKEACQVSGNYFYIFPTAEEAKRALWTKVLEDGTKLLDMIPEPFIGRISNQEMSITISKDKLGVSSTIQVLGLDRNPNAIRGVTPMGVVLSEFAFSDVEAYRALLPALRRKGCWHIINSTPNGRNHFYNLFLGAKESPKWIVSFKQALYPDRPNYVHVHPQDYFEDQVKTGMTTWDDIEREYGCNFTVGMKGAYYADQIEQAYKEDRITDVIYNDVLTVDTFWDLGVDDSTAIWFRQKSGNKISFVDYYEDNGKNLQHYIKVLEAKGYNYGTHYLPHDARQRNIQSGMATADMFEDMLRQTQMSANVEVLDRLPVQDGINAVRSRFSRYHFDAGACLVGIKRLELYHRRYDKKRQVFIKEPVHDGSSHAADAIRMEAISEDITSADQFNSGRVSVISDYDLFA